MAVDEHSRHVLHTRLEQVLGEQEALTLMELTPPVGWGEVATRRDLDELRVATKHDLDDLRVATKHDLDDLRVATKHDLDELRVATKHDFAELKNDFRGLKSEFQEMKTDFRGLGSDLREIRAGYQDLRTVIDNHFRTTIFAVLTLMITLSGLAFAAAKLG